MSGGVAGTRLPWVDEAALRAALAPAPDDVGARADAAVLVPLLPEGVLLTRRAAHLRLHAGQVAFPGGRIDGGDASIEAAALREAEEEIGLPRGCVTVLGRLPGLVTGTGIFVVPVVGRVDGAPALRPDPAEVDCIFTLAASVLIDPAAPRRQCAGAEGRGWAFWTWPHPEQTIWGATAAILVSLAAAVARAGTGAGRGAPW